MSVDDHLIPVPDMDAQGDFLKRIDLRLKRRNQSLSANLLAWMGVLDALGWNVALFLPSQPPMLSARAREWAVERLETAPCRESILARLAAMPPANHLVNTAQLQVWSEVGPDRRAAAEQAPSAPLTKREAEVLAWLREGKTGPEIAVILGCAQRTVESHVARLYRKIGARHRTQLHFNTDPTER